MHAYSQLIIDRHPGTGSNFTRVPCVFLNQTKAPSLRTFGIAAPITCATLDAHQSMPLFEWCRARGNWNAAEWNQVVFSDELRFNLSSDDNCVCVWKPHGEILPLLYSDTPLPQLV
ncbi:uncharacterized protein TNCV_3287921 [Trichonephila clavipes]|nr:uncharacterized protein TNCV_3287921 [Trichonephila clavipes]